MKIIITTTIIIIIIVIIIIIETNTCYLIGNMAESYRDLCDLKNLSTVFRATFSYFSIAAFLQSSGDFRVFMFGVKG